MARKAPAKAPVETPKTIGFLLVPGFALMSYAAAVEPLRAANHLSGKILYRWWNAAPGGSSVTASNGLAIIPDVETGDDDTAESLQKRVFEQECEAYPDAIRLIAEGRLMVENRRVFCRS